MSNRISDKMAKAFERFNADQETFRKESEDEKIRKELLEEIEFIIPHDDETDSEGLILPSYHARIGRYKSYLEKQKEQMNIYNENPDD